MRNTVWSASVGAALLMAVLAVPAAASDAEPSAPVAEAGPDSRASPSAEATQALFRADAPPPQRADARRQTIEAAMKGDGAAAFRLGALFRLGMEHPAQAVERDLDTARYWLEKCVDAPRCPALALASLAELEIEAGRYREAMQWAQAWAAVERELHALGRRPGESSFRPASYTAYLLKRCFEYLPKQGREDAVAEAFTEFQQRRGAQLQRMAAAAAAVAAVPLREQQRAEFAASRYNHPVQASRRPTAPAVALYLLRADPAGGRPEAVTLIEALPSPREALAFAGVARRWESRPYAPDTADERRYAMLPIELSDPRYAVDLTP
ncbi:hypothetical protein [Cognatilysobacter bugurensis]|uniref:Sel1 repeat family protein n=1 Tax=Cognatilysobacter bugurensis TaxID=543356 RepID=A0A918T2R5_9GAMM|nr:hypothetical protein [Lysobacter bugurensis]GHA84898.1 hypothetical protein GCM10007067_23550 [Lysobacter bugurensis]